MSRLGYRQRLWDWAGSHRVLDWSSKPIDWLFVGLTTQWILFVAVYFQAYGVFLVEAATLERGVGPVFPVTYASAICLALYGLIIFRRRYGVDYVRSLIYAGGLAVAATSLFEILWQNVGSGTGVGNQALLGQLINFSSMALALCSIRYWSTARPILFSAIAYLLGWLLWTSIGYPQWYNSDPHLANIGLAFNVSLKVGSFVMLGLLVSFGPPAAGWRRRGPQTSF